MLLQNGDGGRIGAELGAGGGFRIGASKEMLGDVEGDIGALGEALFTTNGQFEVTVPLHVLACP
jgi:hypothetical protein